MSVQHESRTHSQSPENVQSHKWLGDVRAVLTRKAQDASDLEYLASIDIGTTAAKDRHFPRVELDPSTDRFLAALEQNLWNGHVQAQFAELEERRQEFISRERTDPIVEQYEAIRIVLDRPSLYID